MVSCTSSINGPSSSNNKPHISWFENNIHFNGITYVAPLITSGRPLTESDLGPDFATVKFKLAGNVQDLGYQEQDGDAVFLAVGAKIYTVKGYSSTFRLAAQWGKMFALYEADTNPRARTGADLLDISGKVQYIGISSVQDEHTELGVIKDPKQVNTLITQILQAPVDQNRQTGIKRYVLAFHLIDGTVVTRNYWLDASVLDRGIFLPRAFGLAIQAAVPAGQE